MKYHSLKIISFMVILLVQSGFIFAQKEDASLLFVGDIMLSDGPGDFISNNKDPFEAFYPLFSSQDIRIANLECVISSKGLKQNKIHTFRAKPAVLPYLKRSFDLLGLANNHSGDYGAEALADMFDLLNQYKIPFFGAGLSLAKAHEPYIWEYHGLKIAFLAYNGMMPRYFEADADKPGVAWSEDEQVVYDIKRAKSVYHADLVIPFMHWGWELDTSHSQKQEHLAHLMIDAGADAVVGAHPHVTQEIEIYKNKPIVYSLGNFVFDGFFTSNSRHGWILTMKANRQGVYDLKTIDVCMNKQGIPAFQKRARCDDSI